MAWAPLTGTVTNKKKSNIFPIPGFNDNINRIGDRPDVSAPMKKPEEQVNFITDRPAIWSNGLPLSYENPEPIKDPDADINAEVQDFSDKLDQVNFPTETPTDTITETPAETSVDTPVVDGSETTITWEEPDIEDTTLDFTLDNFNRIADKPANQRTSDEKQFLLNLNTRFATGQLNRDSFFKWDDWKQKTGDTVSTEGSLNMADRILAWDKELANLWLQPNASDARIRDFFESQWYSQDEITWIMNARDTRLREQRISWDRETMVEKKQKELDERTAREKQDILDQVKRSQNLLQRQRSLRWVWRSSVTEADLADLQAKWDNLISAAQTKANNEMALFTAQAEWAEADTIAALQKALQDSTKALNDEILAQVELENKLVAQGKMDTDAAWESLMTSLTTAWVDKEWADKFVSENTGVLRDKFGKPIRDEDGNLITIGWTSAEQGETINAFADSMLRWEITATWVPSELRGKVLKTLAVLRKTKWELSFAQQWEALSLSEDIFWNTKEDSVAAVEGMMLEWMTPEEIRQSLESAWFSPKYTWAIRSGLWQASLWLTEWAAWRAESLLNRALSEWNEDEAKEVLLKAVLEWTGVEWKNLATWRKTLINNIIRIKKAMDKWLETEEWRKTWKISGTLEEILQKVWWATWDPDLANIATQINLAIQSYRKAQSWAAFSESEALEYAAIFPWIDKTIDLNNAKIAAVIDVFTNANNDFYSTWMWEWNFAEVFPNWVNTIIHPWLGLAEDVDIFKWIDTTTIGTDTEPSASDLADMYQKNVLWTWQDFDETDIDATKWFLDEGLTSPDTTGWTNDLGFQEQMQVARTWDNVAKDTNNPWNITADNIPAWQTKEQYGKVIWASWTYLSPNGREYFVFSDTTSWTAALKRDLLAKIQGKSRNITPNDTLARFQRVYVWQENPWYLSVLEKITWVNRNTPIKDINPDLLTQAVMKAEWFNS